MKKSEKRGCEKSLVTTPIPTSGDLVGRKITQVYRSVLCILIVLLLQTTLYPRRAEQELQKRLLTSRTGSSSCRLLENELMEEVLDQTNAAVPIVMCGDTSHPFFGMASAVDVKNRKKVLVLEHGGTC